MCIALVPQVDSPPPPPAPLHTKGANERRSSRPNGVAVERSGVGPYALGGGLIVRPQGWGDHHAF